MEAGLELMLNGRQVSAKEALDWGLVDRIGSGSDALAADLAYARELLAPLRRTRDATEALADRATQRRALDAARAEVATRSRGLFSPRKIVDAVEAALDLPFEAGLAVERELFRQCIASPQRQG